MRKKCQTCDNEFEAKEVFHKYCPRCIPSAMAARGEPAATVTPTVDNIQNLLIKEYYDQEGNLKKEIFVGTPKKIADIFVHDMLKTKQLRDFHGVIAKARKRAALKGIESVRAVLYKCQADTEYQLKRGVVPPSFDQFMKHHLALAEKDEKSLEAFFQHYDSILCYFPINKG
jgi:CRISPR/Cas system CSM-associated protein Csm2 small subunit